MSSEELIMSKDKYPSIFFKPNGGYCVYYASNIFRNTHLGYITAYSPVYAGAYLVIACERKYLMDALIPDQLHQQPNLFIAEKQDSTRLSKRRRNLRR